MVCARQCREQLTQDAIANAGDNSPRDPSRFAVDRSLQRRGDVTAILTSHLSSWLSADHSSIAHEFSCGARRRQRSSLRFDRASRTASGVDTVCAPLESGICAMVEV
jgi:hypothetical protein